MSGVARPTTAGAQERVARAIDDGIAVCRLAHLRRAALAATMAPAFVLWIHSQRPLPDLLAWLGTVGWAAAAGLAVVAGVLARYRRRRLRKRLAGVEGTVQLEFPSHEPRLTFSAVVVELATAASTLLWAHAMIPGALPSDLIARFGFIWVGLTLLAVSAKSVEIRRALRR